MTRVSRVASVADVAARHGLSESSVRRYARANDLPRLGSSFVVDEEAEDEIVEQLAPEAEDEEADEDEEYEGDDAEYEDDDGDDEYEDDEEYDDDEGD